MSYWIEVLCNLDSFITLLLFPNICLVLVLLIGALIYSDDIINNPEEILEWIAKHKKAITWYVATLIIFIILSILIPNAEYLRGLNE